MNGLGYVPSGALAGLNVLIEVASGIAVFPGSANGKKSYITCYFAEAGLRRIQISIF